MSNLEEIPLREPDLIAFAGDWHGNTNWAVNTIHACAERGVQAIVQAGDFGFDFPSNFLHRLRYALDETDIDLLFVKGNHDDPGLLAHWPRDSEGFGHPPVGGKGMGRLRWIPQGHRWNWWGKTFMGLGGAVSVDKYWRQENISWWRNEEISLADMHKAVEGGKVDVMITHDLPAAARLPNDRKSGGWPQEVLDESQRHRELLQQVVDRVQPALLVHGHFHARFEQKVGEMRVVGLDMDSTREKDNLYITDETLIEIPYCDLS
jgi:predicted phosphodiesterase